MMVNSQKTGTMSQQETYAITAQDREVLSDFATQVRTYFQTLNLIDQIRAQINQKRKELITPDVQNFINARKLARKALKGVSVETPAEAIKNTILLLQRTEEALKPYKDEVAEKTKPMKEKAEEAREQVKALRVSIPQSFNNAFIQSLVRK